MSSPLNSMLHPNGNVVAYTFANNYSASGQGFVVRTGLPGAYHYARVLIKSIGGALVRGPKGGHFIELEVSYQHGENVPFAKRTTAAVGVYATPGHRRAH